MMTKFVTFVFATILIINIIHGQFTKKQNDILSRKKRYLRFPEGSNFVVTGSAIKSPLLQTPPGLNTIIELDVFFKLPTQSDKKKLKKHYYHYRQRREIYRGIADIIYNQGYDGDACVKRLICEVQNFMDPQENSLFQQIMSTVFLHPSISYKPEKICNKDLNDKCTTSLLDIFLNYNFA